MAVSTRSAAREERAGALLLVVWDYDAVGRLSGVRNQPTGSYYAGGDPSDVTNRIQYTAHGAASVTKLGNGLWEHTAFNSRQQTTEIGLGSSAGDSSVLRLGYTYGEVVGGTLDQTRNNGNLQSQTITAPGLTATQTYTYDTLNRLSVAQENAGTSWKQTFTYDRYGNRSIDTANTTQAFIGENPQINTSTNRITNRSGEHYHYDAAGNLDCSQGFQQCEQGGRTYSYDGENRQTTYLGGADQGGASYFYDGDGRRVKKIAASVMTVFVYDAAGQMVAEYSTQVPANPEPITSYLTEDTLGTPRVITGGTAEIRGRHDYLPFGEEISSSVGGRMVVQGYGSTDYLRQQFTGKERDDETGLDFFEARYYSSPQARFTSVDPVTVTPERQDDPQRLNLYAYVRNNPLTFTDPTGMIIDTQRLNKKDLKRWEKIVAIMNAKDKNGNPLHPKLNALYNKLQSDSRTFYIQGGKLGSSDEAGRFEVETFKGENDFSAARITLDFNKIKNAEVGAALFGDFKQFEGLRKNEDRFAEVAGHEFQHGADAIDDPANAVRVQRLINETVQAVSEANRARIPISPDVQQKLDEMNQRLERGERSAYGAERDINRELRPPPKKKH